MTYKISQFPEVKGETLSEVLSNFKSLVQKTAAHEFTSLSDKEFCIVREDGEELTLLERIELFKLFEQEILSL